MKYRTKERLEAIGGLAAISLVLISAVLSAIWDPDHQEEEPRKLKTSLSLPTPALPDPSRAFETKAAFDKAKAITAEVLGIKATINALELPKTEAKLTSLGKYYITGYTSLECGGSTTTASGTTCHKAASIADSIDNPTTCAIDPAIHDFGDVFFIDGFGYFIAEDTGSAVKGKHLDLYFFDNEYNYALSITGKYEVFAVEYVDTTFQAGAYDISAQVAEQMTGWSFKTNEEETDGIL